MKNRKIISITILLIMLAFAFYYINKNINEFKDISFTNPYFIIILVILLLFHIFITGTMNAQPLKVFRIFLKNWKIFQLAIITRFYNLITPFRGGMAARAVYLKKHKFSYTDFLATLAASYVLIFLVAGIFGLISTYYIYQTTGQLPIVIFSIFLIAVISMLSIILFSLKFSKTRHPFITCFIRVINGWHLHCHDTCFVCNAVINRSISYTLKN